ncbi:MULTISPECIES: WXG100 family type VII secretion target [unclassified Micromonospora]|uniref:WXG100 family type VII secretion target n=1 Tax=unclassified Micromonospora TaxID=2617518 RepID=UPI0033B416E5
MSGFEVDPALLRSGGDAVIGVAQGFIGELESFESQMQGFGEPWGADDIGSLIGVAYTAVAAWVLDCIGEAAEEIGSAGSDLTLMADNYEAAEQDTAGMIQALHGQLG